MGKSWKSRLHSEKNWISKCFSLKKTWKFQHPLWGQFQIYKIRCLKVGQKAGNPDFTVKKKWISEWFFPKKTWKFQHPLWGQFQIYKIKCRKVGEKSWKSPLHRKKNWITTAKMSEKSWKSWLLAVKKLDFQQLF